MKKMHPGPAFFVCFTVATSARAFVMYFSSLDLSSNDFCSEWTAHQPPVGVPHAACWRFGTACLFWWVPMHKPWLYIGLNVHIHWATPGNFNSQRRSPACPIPWVPWAQSQRGTGRSHYEVSSGQLESCWPFGESLYELQWGIVQWVWGVGCDPARSY